MNQAQRLSVHSPASSSLEAPPQQGYLEVAPGCRVFFEDSGGSGIPLFYIYGLGCSILHWKYPRRWFAGGDGAGQRRRQIYMDFRGHGRSDPPPPGQRLTLDHIIGDIRAVTAHLQTHAAIFLGQSMGGSIALRLGAEARDLTAGLVLLTSPGRNPAGTLPLQPLSRGVWNFMINLNARAPWLVRAGYDLAAPLRNLPPVAAALREVIRQGGFNVRLARTEDIEEYIDMVFKVDPVLFYDLAEELSQFDVADIEPPIDVPALVVAGGRDRIVPPAETLRLLSHLPRGHLVMVPHGSHCPHFDDPPKVNRSIEQFLVDSGL